MLYIYLDDCVLINVCDIIKVLKRYYFINVNYGGVICKVV